MCIRDRVYEAHDGMEALPILTSRRPQIVLSDKKMPRMNGFELCRYIKQKPDLNYMPVILLTSLSLIHIYWQQQNNCSTDDGQNAASPIRSKSR